MQKTPPARKRKSNITLLEVVIVCLLVGLMAGVTTVSIADLLRRESTSSAALQFKDLIDELQIEALALRSDMEIRIYKDKHGWKARSYTSEKVLRNRIIDLKGVREVLFNQAPKKEFKLEIFSTGRIAPEGVLCLKQEGGNINIEIKENHANYKPRLSS